GGRGRGKVGSAAWTLPPKRQPGTDGSSIVVMLLSCEGGRTFPALGCCERRAGRVSWDGMSDLTDLLKAVERGEPRAAEALLPLVYDELRALAARKLAGENPGQTLQPTALVHEAYLRLFGHDEPCSFRDRSHFLATCAQAMRRILVDNARRKQARKRG